MHAQRDGAGKAGIAQDRGQEPRPSAGAAPVRDRVIRVKRKRAAPSHDALFVDAGGGSGEPEEEHPAKRGREVSSLMASLALDGSGPRPSRRPRRFVCPYPCSEWRRNRVVRP